MAKKKTTKMNPILSGLLMGSLIGGIITLIVYLAIRKKKSGPTPPPNWGPPGPGPEPGPPSPGPGPPSPGPGPPSPSGNYQCCYNGCGPGNNCNAVGTPCSSSEAACTQCGVGGAPSFWCPINPGPGPSAPTPGPGPGPASACPPSTNIPTGPPGCGYCCHKSCKNCGYDNNIFCRESAENCAGGKGSCGAVWCTTPPSPTPTPAPSSPPSPGPSPPSPAPPSPAPPKCPCGKTDPGGKNRASDGGCVDNACCHGGVACEKQNWKSQTCNAAGWSWCGPPSPTSSPGPPGPATCGGLYAPCPNSNDSTLPTCCPSDSGKTLECRTKGPWYSQCLPIID